MLIGVLTRCIEERGGGIFDDEDSLGDERVRFMVNEMRYAVGWMEVLGLFCASRGSDGCSGGNLSYEEDDAATSICWMLK